MPEDVIVDTGVCKTAVPWPRMKSILLAALDHQGLSAHSKEWAKDLLDEMKQEENKNSSC